MPSTPASATARAGWRSDPCIPSASTFRRRAAPIRRACWRSSSTACAAISRPASRSCSSTPTPEAGWNVPERLAKLAFYDGRSDVSLSTDARAYARRNHPVVEAFDSLADENLYRVRPDESLCDRAERGRCVNAIGDRVFYYDDDHLSNAGAALVVPSIVDQVTAIRETSTPPPTPSSRCRSCPARPSGPGRLGVEALPLPAAAVEDRLGIAVRLLAPSKTRSRAAWKATEPSRSGAIGAVERVAGVLPVDDGGHAAKRLLDLLAVTTPWRSQLAMCCDGDAQRRAVLHQPDVVDVGHLRAADALVDPAHDVAEDALGVVVELALDLLGASSSAAPPAGCVRSRRAARGSRAIQLRLRARRRRRGDSGSRAASPPSATAPRRSWRPPSDGRSSGSSMPAIRSGIAHMPLPIWARPGRPQARPTSTFQSS